MADGMAMITVKGRLTRDPSLSKTGKGSDMVRFTVARTARTPGDDISQYFDCTAFGVAAKTIAEHFEKGSGITVVGSFYSNEYQKKDGTKGFGLRVDVNQFAFEIGSGGGSKKKSPKREETVPADSGDDDDEIPF